MILLRRRDNFIETVALDIPTGKPYIFHQAVPCGKVQGHFSFQLGCFCALFRCQGKLFLRFGDDLLEIADRTVARLEDTPSGRILIVEESGKELFRKTYPKPVIDPPLDGLMTPMGEEEDFDFGLFIHNVLNDKRRKQAIFNP
ncbi:MAG: hypothetical protein N3A38_15630 [Planctomycetota bacterium]|nr:hypothetical protein [Planctomycetota bacterium]